MLREAHRNNIEALANEYDLDVEIVPYEGDRGLDSVHVHVDRADPYKLGGFLTELGRGYNYFVRTPAVDPGPGGKDVEHFEAVVTDSRGILSSL